MKTTRDGSSTLYVPELDEHYHSVHGAVQESRHVFLKMGFQHLLPRPHIDILEIGLGTGLNFWLTAEAVQDLETTVRYVGVDKYPVTREETDSVDYSAFLRSEFHFYDKSFIADSQVSEVDCINNKIRFEILESDFRDLNFSEAFDLIYYDAFGPRVQPHLWTQDLFEIMYRALRPGGVLVTYCAKGQVRRDMLACGFQVERLPGPPGKREMLRATK